MHRSAVRNRTTVSIQWNNCAPITGTVLNSAEFGIDKLITFSKQLWLTLPSSLWSCNNAHPHSVNPNSPVARSSRLARRHGLPSTVAVAVGPLSSLRGSHTASFDVYLLCMSESISITPHSLRMATSGGCLRQVLVVLASFRRLQVLALYCAGHDQSNCVLWFYS
jgi:hypothetical protein